MENAYYLIYVTVNDITEEEYLGQHCTFNPKDDYLGSGNLINDAIRKYGRENFKRYIIEECNDIFHLAKREFEWIKAFDAINRDDWYNIDYRCYPNFIFEYGHKEESKKLMKELAKGKGKGRKLTEEHKNNIRKARMGWVFSEKSKEKMRIKALNRHHTEETKNKISAHTKIAMEKPEVQEKLHKKRKYAVCQ